MRLQKIDTKKLFIYTFKQFMFNKLYLIGLLLIIIAANLLLVDRARVYGSTIRMVKAYKEYERTVVRPDMHKYSGMLSEPILFIPSYLIVFSMNSIEKSFYIGYKDPENRVYINRIIPDDLIRHRPILGLDSFSAMSVYGTALMLVFTGYFVFFDPNIRGCFRSASDTGGSIMAILWAVSSVIAISIFLLIGSALMVLKLHHVSVPLDMPLIFYAFLLFSLYHLYFLAGAVVSLKKNQNHIFIFGKLTAIVGVVLITCPINYYLFSPETSEHMIIENKEGSQQTTEFGDGSKNFEFTRAGYSVPVFIISPTTFVKKSLDHMSGMCDENMKEFIEHVSKKGKTDSAQAISCRYPKKDRTDLLLSDKQNIFIADSRIPGFYTSGMVTLTALIVFMIIYIYKSMVTIQQTRIITQARKNRNKRKRRK